MRLSDQIDSAVLRRGEPVSADLKNLVGVAADFMLPHLSLCNPMNDNAAVGMAKLTNGPVSLLCRQS